MKAQEVERIQIALKTIIKDRGQNYKKVADMLGSSEATVKRMLNGDKLEFSKLMEVCSLLGVSFYDLVELSKDHGKGHYYFNLEQENYLARDAKQLLFLRALIKGRSLSQYAKVSGIKKDDLNSIAMQLERLKLIELWPKEKIKVLASFPFKWLEGGPLERKYFPEILEKLASEGLSILMSPNSSKQSYCKPFELVLAKKSAELLQIEMRDLYSKYQAVSAVEINMKNSDTRIISGLLLAGPFSAWKEGDEL